MAEPLSGIVGFLGAGRMATALARGWVRAGLVRADRCRASDPVPRARETFTAETGCHAGEDNRAVAAASDLLVLAVKPQTLPALLPEVRPALRSPLVVSVAAGVPLARLGEGLGPDARIVRVMPNTPCLVGAGAAGYAANDRATAEDIALVDQLLNTVGRAFRLPEGLLDAVTGLSGSGPAFVALMVEALADGGVLAGLPRDVALPLAAQTVLGTARMLLEEGLHPGQLKDRVASPGGTTIAGLHALERAGLRGALMDAVAAAARRSQELGGA